MATQPVVAVINTNQDLLELLKTNLEAAGFVVLVLHVAKIRGGQNVAAVLSQHNPKVIVYDVAAPFLRNWRFLEHLRETVFKDRLFVLTSPNAGVLERLAGKDKKVYEILDDDRDIHAIVQAVRKASRARPTI
jgi:CheY-like chemotaxis protein